MARQTVRKQFYLRSEQNAILMEVSRREKMSEAEIIRRALEEYLLGQFPLPPEEPLSALAGIGAGGRSSSNRMESGRQ